MTGIWYLSGTDGEPDIDATDLAAQALARELARGHGHDARIAVATRPDGSYVITDYRSYVHAAEPLALRWIHYGEHTATVTTGEVIAGWSGEPIPQPAPVPHPDDVAEELPTYPIGTHNRDSGSWCPWSGSRTYRADAWCPDRCEEIAPQVQAEAGS